MPSRWMKTAASRERSGTSARVSRHRRSSHDQAPQVCSWSHTHSVTSTVDGIIQLPGRVVVVASTLTMSSPPWYATTRSRQSRRLATRDRSPGQVSSQLVFGQCTACRDSGRGCFPCSRRVRGSGCALGRIRTCGLLLRRQSLYPLSYEGWMLTTWGCGAYGTISPRLAGSDEIPAQAACVMLRQAGPLITPLVCFAS